MRPYIAYEYTSFDWYDGVATASDSVSAIAPNTPHFGSVPRVHPSATSATHPTSAPTSNAARSEGVSHCTATKTAEMHSVASASAHQTSTVPKGSAFATRAHASRNLRTVNIVLSTGLPHAAHEAPLLNR